MSFSSVTICLTACCSDRHERTSLVLGLMKQSPSRYEIGADIYVSCLEQPCWGNDIDAVASFGLESFMYNNLQTSLC